LPLFEKARVEVYLPDLPKPAYQDLLDTLGQEFTYTFGGCTIIHGLDGSHLSQMDFMLRDRVNLILERLKSKASGSSEMSFRLRDRVNLIYTDTP